MNQFPWHNVFTRYQALLGNADQPSSAWRGRQKGEIFNLMAMELQVQTLPSRAELRSEENNTGNQVPGNNQLIF
jgi:hypothetical protein